MKSFAFLSILFSIVSHVHAQAPSAKIKNMIENCFKIECFKHNNAVKSGSGFILTTNSKNIKNQDSVIYFGITNEHVLDNSDSAVIIFSDNTKISIKSVLHSNHLLDVCVFTFNGGHNRTGVMSNIDSILSAKNEVGNNVYAISSPKGLTNTLSTGIVSAIRSEMGRELIQTTAPISPGSSGGLLTDYSGYPIGMIVSQYSQGQNLNFAIPMRLIVEDLRKKSFFESLQIIKPQNNYSIANLPDLIVKEDSLLNDIRSTLDNDELTQNKLSQIDDNYLTEVLLFLKFSGAIRSKNYNIALPSLILSIKKYSSDLSGLELADFMTKVTTEMKESSLAIDLLNKLKNEDNELLGAMYSFIKGYFTYLQNPEKSNILLDQHFRYVKKSLGEYGECLEDSTFCSLNRLFALTTFSRSCLMLGELARNRGNYSLAFNYFNTGLNVISSFKIEFVQVWLSRLSQAAVVSALQNNDTKSACFINKIFKPQFDDPAIINYIKSTCTD